MATGTPPSSSTSTLHHDGIDSASWYSLILIRLTYLCGHRWCCQCNTHNYTEQRTDATVALCNKTNFRLFNSSMVSFTRLGHTAIFFFQTTLFAFLCIEDRHRRNTSQPVYSRFTSTSTNLHSYLASQSVVGVAETPNFLQACWRSTSSEGLNLSGAFTSTESNSQNRKYRGNEIYIARNEFLSFSLYNTTPRARGLIYTYGHPNTFS